MCRCRPEARAAVYPQGEFTTAGRTTEEMAAPAGTGPRPGQGRNRRRHDSPGGGPVAPPRSSPCRRAPSVRRRRRRRRLSPRHVTGTRRTLQREACNGRGKRHPGGQRRGPGRHSAGEAGRGGGREQRWGNRGGTEQPFLAPAPAPTLKVDTSPLRGRPPLPAAPQPSLTREPSPRRAGGVVSPDRMPVGSGRLRCRFPLPAFPGASRYRHSPPAPPQGPEGPPASPPRGR
ncbi:PREDICTED: proline-rich protein 2-like [Calidris pugnax]|uniref:proline-rich protein 2-like n=1 Tax=Calidris pugnax TaxID=198806 RepID=UPI00071C9A70|nr:PREDICTED: proline-rich protein 2-like [Calidris pugnax]